jgi:tetratricopeptide (TPR) repeat protein/transcriptional regulator with XRE-family HTH domain
VTATREVVVFGEMVRDYRLRQGITQEELAEAAGLSVRGIGKIEAGRTDVPRSTTVRLLAEAFGLTGAERDRFRQAAVGEPVAQPTPPTNTPPVHEVPAQLPMDVPAFAGRSRELARLDAVLTGMSERPGAVVISALLGTAGVGKTALAIHWAHRVADRFPDGQLYINLRGFDPGGQAMRPAEAIRRFLDGLGVAPQRIPADLDAQAALYRSLLARRRVLVVLDNARDAEQVRLLLPGASGCLVLVTSRHQLPGLVAAEAAHPITLDLLTETEAHQLLTGRLGVDRLAAEPAPASEIIARCARLPLALAVVAARAATYPGFPLATLAAELRKAGAGLDAFAGDDGAGDDVRAVFSWSYRTLTDDAARLFRLLGLHPGPDITADAAASTTGLPAAEVRPLLAQLAHAHLITEHVPGRYTLHDLLRAYAAELAHAHDNEDERRAALHRMFDHYLHTARTAKRLLSPQRDPITPVPARPGVAAENLADHEDALAWCTAEHQVLLAIIRRAADAGFGTHTWQLAWTLSDFFAWRGHWHDQIATQHIALDTTRRLADHLGQAHAHNALGGGYAWLSRYDDAHTHLRHALHLFDQLDDRIGQAHTQLRLSWVFDRQGRHKESLFHACQALELYQEDEYPAGQAMALNNLGWLHTQLGDHQRALTYCRQALALTQQIGDRSGQAVTWDSLGYAHHGLGHHRDAIACYQNSLGLSRDVGNRYYEADIAARLGDTHHAAGEPAAARDAWHYALTILADLRHPDVDRVRGKLDKLDHPDE